MREKEKEREREIERERKKDRKLVPLRLPVNLEPGFAPKWKIQGCNDIGNVRRCQCASVTRAPVRARTDWRLRPALDLHVIDLRVTWSLVTGVTARGRERSRCCCCSCCCCCCFFFSPISPYGFSLFFLAMAICRVDGTRRESESGFGSIVEVWLTAIAVCERSSV